MSLSLQLPDRQWDYKIALIGEAPSEHEYAEDAPFVGPSGHILDECLRKEGIPRDVLFLANTFNVEAFSVIRVDKRWTDEEPFNKPLPQGGYLHPSMTDHVRMLRENIKVFSPDVIVPMGAYALWALTGRTDISAARGLLLGSPFGPIIPTFNPASAIQGAYSNRILIRFDLAKVLNYLRNPSLFSSPRLIHIPETVSDVQAIYEKLRGIDGVISYDIETARGFVDCIGFGVSASEAYVVPFAKFYKNGIKPYWPSPTQFRAVWLMTKTYLEEPKERKVPLDLLADRLPDPQLLDRLVDRLYGENS